MSQALQITQSSINEAKIRVLEGENTFLRNELVSAVATATELARMLDERDADVEPRDGGVTDDAS